ncbi:MAG: hypothetical protein FWD79_00025 [Desulfobulbus sp.]|nr:hypothetical protein [Desulfobulbus sp.]
MAADYIRQDYETFRKSANGKKLYADGVIDAANFIIGEERFANRVGGSLLIFDSRHRQPVVGDISVGNPLEKVFAAYGRPDFALQDRNLIGYKTARYYLAFRGTKSVERIYVAKRNVQKRRDGILPAYLDDGGDKWNFPREVFPFAAWGLRHTQLWRGSMTYCHPDGLYIWIDADPKENQVYIFNDYTGLAPKQPAAKDNIHFVGYDYPENKMYLAVHEEEALQKQFADEGSHSPDKRMAAVVFGNCTYERAGLLFRYLDGNGPDTFITPGHFPDKPIWLSGRYVGIETMLGFGIYDLQANPATEADAVFYMQYLDPAGPFIKYFDQENETLVFGTNGVTIRKKSGDETIEIPEDEHLLLHLRYDKQGNISVTTGKVRESVSQPEQDA